MRKKKILVGFLTILLLFGSFQIKVQARGERHGPTICPYCHENAMYVTCLGTNETVKNSVHYYFKGIKLIQCATSTYSDECTFSCQSCGTLLLDKTHVHTIDHNNCDRSEHVW